MKMEFYEDAYGMLDELYDVLNKNGQVAVIGEDETIKDLAMYFTDIEEFDIALADIDSFSYDREYIMTIDDEEGTLYIEKAYNENHGTYIGVDGVIFVQDTVNSKFIVDVKNHDLVEAEFRLFTFDYEEIEEDDAGMDEDPQTCFEWDPDHRGFFYCECLGDTKRQFAYRGSSRLTDEAAQAIIKYRMN